jgi:hypothetical protein
MALIVTAHCRYKRLRRKRPQAAPIEGRVIVTAKRQIGEKDR